MSKVLHLGWSYTPHTARWINALKKRNHDLALISYGGDPLSDVTTHIIPQSSLGKIGYLLNLSKVKKIARQFNPEIVHAHFATGYGFWGERVGRHPLVISCHGSDIIASARKGALVGIVKRNLAAADQIIVPSAFLAEQIVGLGVKLKREPALIQIGIEPSATEALYQKRAQELSHRQSPKLLFFKHHRAEYGPSVALQAFQQIKKTIPAASLTMAGHGPLTDDLRQLTERLGLTDSVSFPGFIPLPDAISYIAQHTLMLMPTIVPESFGVSALEASAVGVPTIASEVGGVPEIVRDGQTGLLVPPNDPQALAAATINLLENAALLKQMSQKARELVVNEFNWSSKVDQLEQLYQNSL